MQDTKDTTTIRFSLRFYIGIILLTINQPLGWGAMLICNAIALNRQDLFFTYLGLVIYALTWGMMGLGVLLAGPEGIRYSRLLLKRGWRYCTHLFQRGNRG